MENTTKYTPKRAAEGPSKKLPAGVVAGIAAAVVLAAAVGGYFGFCSWVKGNDCLLPGAIAVDDQGETVADLGRLPQKEALSVVTGEMDQRLENRTLTLLYGDGKRAYLTGDLMACAPEAAVAVGMSAKEEQPLWKLGALWLGLAEEPVSLSLTAAEFTPEGEAKAKQVIQAIADELYAAPTDFIYEVGEDTVEVTPGADGRQLDTGALLLAVEDALVNGETELQVEPEVIPSAELSGQVLSDLIYVEPKPAGVDSSGNLTPAVVGVSVDAEKAQAILDETPPGETCSIPLKRTPPESSSGDPSLYFKDLLSSVTTNMDGVANRSFNVNRAAEFCNGKILQPGEVFSYLGTIGSPVVANGYKLSTGYLNGETVPMDGGGVCQVSSSLYYCAVYANLEIVKRANHAFATGYIPNGLDATVSSPNLDFKFRNNTGYPIKIVAYTQGGAAGQLVVQFYGSNPNGTHVETERYTQSTTGWTTVYEADPSIPRGTTKVKTTPYTGYVVDVYRCVYDANGNLISRTYENRSVYAKRDKKILYNPLDSGPWGAGTTEPPASEEPTEPPVTEPPVTEPPVTEPPVTEPPVTEPPVTPPPATEPPVTPPPATDPPVVDTPEPPPPTQYVDLPEGGYEA